MFSRLRAIGIVTLAPYMVLSQSAFPIAAGSSDFASKSRLLVAEAKSSADSSPAVSGVKLLHEIFQKLRNSNQLALNYPNRQLLAASQAIQGSLNPLLAIRPAEKSSNKNNQLAYLQEKSAFPGGYGGASDGLAEVKQTASLKRRALALPAAQNSNMSSANSGLASNMGGLVDLSTDARSQPMSQPQQDKVQSQKSLARSRGVINVANRQDPSFAANPGLSPQNAEMLARSVSKLMQSTRQFSELSQAASESSVRSYGKAKGEVRDERTISTRPGGPVIQEYNSPSQAKDLMQTTTVSTASSSAVARADSDYANNSPLMTPDQPAQFKTMRTLMALLPPSVVGGIPLARLGATEQELTGSLIKKNNATKQVIDDWTVWTVKGSGVHASSVQLYMRHSVVEAIRVFQPSYLGEEVGIKIGDNLGTIKGKFGEPAFILSEPDVANHGAASQNYVYPISHVAFQLSRAKSQPLPQVVSVLIFEVQ